MDSFTREDSTIFEQIEINMWTEGQTEICCFTGIPLGLYQRFFIYMEFPSLLILEKEN